MILVLLQWCYMAFLSFSTGFALLFFLQKKSGYRIRSVSSYLMAGLAVLNVYAQYFSLFAGVGLAANALAVLLCLGMLAVCRRPAAAFLRERFCSCGRAGLAAGLVLTLLFAYGSSRGYLHYDTGLYHAQSIRWIEEYGVVPGLANLHSRFGYNSAAFSLCALFGGAGLTQRPMHCVQGFFALLCAIKCGGLFHLARKGERRVRPSDFLYVGCIFYLVAVFRDLISPASDYFAMLLAFFVLMNWMELWERGEKAVFPYALLAEGLVYAATVKLSAAVLLLLALYPGVMLIRDRKWKQIGFWVLAGVGIAFPYVARNVLISGWPFYPFTLFDFFDVDWKLSKGYADNDANEIRAYAKEIYDAANRDQPFWVWFPHWFFSQAWLDRLFLLADWICVPVGAGVTAWGLTRLFKRKNKDSLSGLPGLCLLEATALLGFLTWQFGAPLVRYGYFYVLFLPLFTVGVLFVRILPGKRGFYAFVIFLVAFLCYRGYNLGNMIREFWREPYYVYQQDYGEWPADTYQVDGVTIYVPLDRGQIGYDKFPSSPVVQDIELRGDSLGAGFRKRSSED